MQNKITFLSRQDNKPSMDFIMLKNELLRREKDIKIVFICKRLESGFIHTVKYALIIIKSIYNIATSKTCILDSYWPAVSVIKNIKHTKIIQIWHAMGKIKKSGYQTLNKTSGRSEKVAKIMRMHQNYDIIIAGGKAWNKFYCESFGVSEDILYNTGLPRMDYLLKNKDNIKDKIHKKYPQFREKELILYAPTFRKTKDKIFSESNEWKTLISKINTDKFNVILKGHPNEKLIYDKNGIYNCDEFLAYELLTVCDYVITDYSAIAVEAALLDKKTLYYLYDYDEYTSRNGLNLDPFIEMPESSFKTADGIINCLESGNYNTHELIEYKKKYLPETLGQATKLIIDKVI